MKTLKVVYRVVDTLALAAAGAVTVVVGVGLFLTDLHSWDLGDTSIGVALDRPQLAGVAVATCGVLAGEVVVRRVLRSWRKRGVR